MPMINLRIGSALIASLLCLVFVEHPAHARHTVPQEHPRLLGSRDQLKELARERKPEYQRVAAVARGDTDDDHSKVISLGLVAAIDGDREAAQEAKQIAMKYIGGPIRQGHVTFAHDLAVCALAFDLGSDVWSREEIQKLVEYVNKTVDANVQSEPHVFHNGWYGYKNWGIGLAGYATYYENPRAKEIVGALEEEYRTRAAPALELAGEGGGWAEGYYIHYWLYEWLFFCETARRCEGVDYYAMAPKFFNHRAVASMFEMYPGIGEYGTRRPAPMGDGGGRRFGGDRDKALSARRILVNYFRDDPAHQAVHAFNELTPRSGVGNYAYKDFLWRDPTVKQGDLSRFKRSHVSTGPGYVYARSSWDDDATYFFFKCGDRFTAHQHLDLGHFLICKGGELAGDGGHYEDFGSTHDVNYHLRSIAHSTLSVLDPKEKWPAIRAGNVTGNDGGQAHQWPHHNGAVADAVAWQKDKALYDIADLLAFEDRGDYVYVAGDATRAYSPEKLSLYTRQIVYLRPGTFVIFDRVRSTRPELKKTWLLQAMKEPTGEAPNLLISGDAGRLFVQTLLPERAEVRFAAGDDLYQYGGQSHPPRRDTGPAPECRVEISPSGPAETDYFLHVLTATDAKTAEVPQASRRMSGDFVVVDIGGKQIALNTKTVGGLIRLDGKSVPLAAAVQQSE